jgi:hypothetical protein
MFSYPTEGYKKYVYAHGSHRDRRLYDPLETLGMGIDISTDVPCSLGLRELWFYLAAFIDDDAGNEFGCNRRELIRADPVNAYSDGRPVAMTRRLGPVPLRSRNPPPVIDVDDELVVSSSDDAEDIIDHVLDATEGIDAMREIDCDDKEQDR